MAQSQARKPGDSVGKSALLFGSGTLTSRILGLIRDALLFALLPKDIRDAWLAAWRVPNLFRRLFGEGGLSVSFIPLFVATDRNGNKKELEALKNGVFSLLMYLVGLICVLCFVFMDPIINAWLSGPGFSEVPGKIEMTISMARVMIFFLFFIILFAYFMALLNARKKFTMTGFAPMLLNLVIIAVLWIFKDSEDLGVAAAWAVVGGGFLQALILIPSVRSEGLMPRLRLQFMNPMVKKVILRFLPTLLAVGTLQILSMVNVYFSSQLPPGTVGYFYMADRLLELPLSLIAVSIGTALLPTLSAYWSEGQTDKFKQCVSKHLSLFFFLALPSAFGLWFMGLEIVEVLFKRGEFTQNDVPIVSDILKVYCLTLLCAGSLKVLNQAFYAVEDTLTPALISIFGLCLHLFLAPILMKHYSINGLALSTASITLINLILCNIFLQRKVGWLKWRTIGKHFAKCLFASSVMGAFLFSLQFFNWRTGRFIVDFPILIFLIGIAGVVFFVTASVFKVEEMEYLKRRITKR